MIRLLLALMFVLVMAVQALALDCSLTINDSLNDTARVTNYEVNMGNTAASIDYSTPFLTIPNDASFDGTLSLQSLPGEYDYYITVTTVYDNGQKSDPSAPFVYLVTPNPPQVTGSCD